MTSLSNISLLLLTALSLVFAPLASADERYINVSGEGTVEVLPDYLTLNILLQAEGQTTQQAKTKVDQAMHYLLEKAQQFEIAKQDIEAASINNSPIYEWVKNERKLRAQQVQRTVTLTLRNLEHHTSLVHQLMQQANLQIQSSQGHFNEPLALNMHTTSLALRQAKQKAENMANTLGVRLGKVLSIEEQGRPVAPMFNLRMSAPQADSSTEPAPLLLQKQTITSTVQVKFAIK